jgi:hypothetical protein
MFYILLLFFAAALWILVEFLFARRGFEDEKGFHLEN